MKENGIYIVTNVDDKNKNTIYDEFKSGDYTKAHIARKYAPMYDVSERTISRVITEMIAKAELERKSKKTTTGKAKAKAKAKGFVDEETRLKIYHKCVGEGMTRKNAAKMFGVSLSTVGRAIKEMRGRDIKVNKTTKIEKVIERVITEPTYIITPNSITISNDDINAVIEKNDPNFLIVKKAIFEEDWKAVLDIVDLYKALKKKFIKFGERVTVDEDAVVTLDGMPLSGLVVDKIIKAIDDGGVADRYVKFLERAYDNPSIKSIDEIWKFISSKSIEINDDGHIVGYKSVKNKGNGKYVDKYTGKIDNSVGAEPEMERESVNHNSHITCSAGLHICSKSYLSFYGSETVVQVTVDPYDVCSIPTDYNQAKMRCCKYKVIGLAKL